MAAFKRAVMLLPFVAALAIATLAVLNMVVTQSPIVTKVDVTLSDYTIKTSRTWLKQGELVQLTVRNDGVLVHEVEVEGYDVEAEDIQPGETRTPTFRVKGMDPVELVCHLPGHYEAGMKTTLRVVE